MHEKSFNISDCKFYNIYSYNFHASVTEMNFQFCGQKISSRIEVENFFAVLLRKY